MNFITSKILTNLISTALDPVLAISEWENIKVTPPFGREIRMKDT